MNLAMNLEFIILLWLKIVHAHLGSSDRTIKVWDLKSKKCIATLQGHEHRVNSLA